MALILGPGTNLDTYVILKEAGAGGTAQTYFVRDTDGQECFAKVFLEPTVADERLRRPYVEEFKFFEGRLKDLLANAEFGARTLRLMTYRGHFVKIAEKLSGEPLSSVLRVATDRQRWFLAACFCFALREAHARGVANLDLKPDAVMVSPPNRNGIRSARMIDFDCGWIDTQRNGTKFRRTYYSATAGYASPEWVIWSAWNSGAAIPGLPKNMYPELSADIFSAGLVLFEIFTGRAVHGFCAPSHEPALEVMMARAGVRAGRLPRIHEHARQFPQGLSDLVDRMLSLDRSARPTAAEVHEQLKQMMPR